MSDYNGAYEHYKQKAINGAYGSGNSAGVVFALLALGERMHEFTEFAKALEAQAQADLAKGDLFMGYDPSVRSDQHER